MSSSEPQIDFTKIEFPSDSLLSFKTLRKQFPALFDSADTRVRFFGRYRPAENTALREYHIENLTNLLEGEREVAMFAFHAALGRSWTHPQPDFSEDEIMRWLTDEYIRYGVANGEHRARQLIRDIEAAAVAQAQSHVKGRR